MIWRYDKNIFFAYLIYQLSRHPQMSFFLFAVLKTCIIIIFYFICVVRKILLGNSNLNILSFLYEHLQIIMGNYIRVTGADNYNFSNQFDNYHQNRLLSIIIVAYFFIFRNKMYKLSLQIIFFLFSRLFFKFNNSLSSLV